MPIGLAAKLGGRAGQPRRDWCGVGPDRPVRQLSQRRPAVPRRLLDRDLRPGRRHHHRPARCSWRDGSRFRSDLAAPARHADQRTCSAWRAGSPPSPCGRASPSTSAGPNGSASRCWSAWSPRLYARFRLHPPAAPDLGASPSLSGGGSWSVFRPGRRATWSARRWRTTMCGVQHAPDRSVLVLMPLRQAIAELEGVEGMQVHRSWWVVRAGRWSARAQGTAGTRASSSATAWSRPWPAPRSPSPAGRGLD